MLRIVSSTRRSFWRERNPLRAAAGKHDYTEWRANAVRLVDQHALRRHLHDV
jgi:hypothetical protein